MQTAYAAYGSSSASQETAARNREYWQVRLQDWARDPLTQKNLLEVGFAVLPGALQPLEVEALLQELPCLVEGGAVRMEQQSKGSGGYDYLRQLPLHLSTLREVAYEVFLPSANEFLQQHCLEVAGCGRSICNELNVRERRGGLPESLQEFESLCERRGQTRESNLLLWYQEGGENRAHRDIYGEVSYPLQMLLLLSQPGQDFNGGRFFTIVDGRKQQPNFANLNCGDLLIFRTSCKHGCTLVKPGRKPEVRRVVVGLQFAKRQLRRERLARESR